MTATTHELDTDTGRILAHLAALNAEIADRTSEVESLKAELRTLQPGDYSLNGRPALRIIATRRFDATAAAQTLPEDVRTNCLTITYDAVKVKEHLTPAQLDTFMVEAGKPKVVLI